MYVFFSDQRSQYEEAILKHFERWRIFIRTGKRGRPRKSRLEPRPDLIYAQVVKHRRKGKVVKVERKLVFGTEEALQEYLKRSSVSHIINTSYKDHWLERQLHLCIGYYHFCLPHAGLREETDPPLPTKGNGSPKKWKQRTLFMAAGITDHVWTLKELLTYRLPPSRKIDV